MLTLQDIPVEKLNLPRKMVHVLHRNGIRTFGDLQKVAQDGNLLELRFVGEKRSREINELLWRVSAHPDQFIESANQDSLRPVNDIGQRQPEAPAKTVLLIHLGGTQIGKLYLPKQVVNALRRAKLFTIGDLLINRNNLSQIKKIGPKSLKAIQTALDKALNSPASYVEIKTPEKPTVTTWLGIEKPKPTTWSEIIEPYLKSEKETRIYILISRLGLNIKTLGEIAIELEVTRERVRQIQVLVVTRFKNQINFIESSRVLINEIMDILSESGENLSLNSFRSILNRRGILGKFSEPIKSRFHNIDPLEVLICWLDILGDGKISTPPRAYPIEINDLRKAVNITIRDHKALQNIPRQKIRKLLRKVIFTGGINLKDAIKILSAPEDITLLELENLNLRKIREQWFSIRSFTGSKNRHPLILAGNKMLSVTEKIEFSSFYDGLRRHAGRFFDSIAPQDIVLHYIKLAGFEVDNNAVLSNTKVENVLSKTEACFIAAVKANGNVANFIEIAEEFRQRGFSMPAVSVVLARSPLVEKIDVGLYKIRGSDAHWTDIENAKKRQKSFSKDAQIIYGLDGTIKYRVTLNTWAVYTGVISTNLIKDLAGEWKVTDQDGRQVIVNMDELFIWGVSNILEEIHANIGDRIELSFNTWNRTLSAQKVNHGDT